MMNGLSQAPRDDPLNFGPPGSLSFDKTRI